MISQLLLYVCIGQRMTGCIVPRALWAAKKGEAEKKRKDESNAVGQQPGGEVVSEVAGLAARLPLLLLDVLLGGERVLLHRLHLFQIVVTLQPGASIYSFRIPFIEFLHKCKAFHIVTTYSTLHQIR